MSPCTQSCSSDYGPASLLCTRKQEHEFIHKGCVWPGGLQQGLLHPNEQANPEDPQIRGSQHNFAALVQSGGNMKPHTFCQRFHLNRWGMLDRKDWCGVWCLSSATFPRRGWGRARLKNWFMPHTLFGQNKGFPRRAWVARAGTK